MRRQGRCDSFVTEPGKYPGCMRASPFCDVQQNILGLSTERWTWKVHLEDFSILLGQGKVKGFVFLLEDDAPVSLTSQLLQVTTREKLLTWFSSQISATEYFRTSLRSDSVDISTVDKSTIETLRYATKLLNIHVTRNIEQYKNSGRPDRSRVQIHIQIRDSGSCCEEGKPQNKLKTGRVKMEDAT